MPLFDNDCFKAYLKYVTIQSGLGGLLTELSPGQIITGYFDTAISKYQEKPIYISGNRLTQPFFQVIQYGKNQYTTNGTQPGPHSQKVIMFTGETENSQRPEIKHTGRIVQIGFAYYQIEIPYYYSL